MNLIDDPWIPVRRRSGPVEWIAPWQLTENFDADPFIEVAAPRPDFNGALVQFLIGLLQTCMPPEDSRAWRSRLGRPPSREELQAAFSGGRSAFSLDGDGPRFLQDLTLGDEIDSLAPTEREERVRPIAELFIGIPTGKTIRNNTDLFVKRGGIEALCERCAAATILTLQINAPSGGQGNRTGIRGGGPLTTLIVAGTLWQTCWLSVLEKSHIEGLGNAALGQPAAAFPWLAPTRTSEGGRTTTPEDARPAQLFWAMPRRVRLVAGAVEGTCSICGCDPGVTFRQLLAKNLGVNYAGPWKHPLSPHFVAPDGTPSPVHPQPGGVGYRHWLGLVISAADEKSRREPAAIVARYLTSGPEDLRLWAFGYDMDNMKARAWCDSTMPLLSCPAETRDLFERHVGALIRGAEMAAFELRRRLREAMFGAGAEVKGELSFVFERFWGDTEPVFFDVLPRLRAALIAEQDAMSILTEWHASIARAAEQIFDDYSQSAAFDVVDPKRVAMAWHRLRSSLHGKKMRETIGLPTVSPRSPSTKKRKAE